MLLSLIYCYLTGAIVYIVLIFIQKYYAFRKLLSVSDIPTLVTSALYSWYGVVVLIEGFVMINRIRRKAKRENKKPIVKGRCDNCGSYAELNNKFLCINCREEKQKC